MKKIALSRSNFIHLLRWVSAFLVVINHLRSIMFKDFNLIKQANIFTKFFYFTTGLGHTAVIIFFVLSGYLISGSVISQIRRDTFDIKKYSLNRFSRLYAVLIVALLLTLVLDHTGIHFDKIGLYTNKIKTATLGFSIADRLSAGHFFSSLFMLQTIVLPPLGSNSPLWSLAYEFWYYVLFPCLCLVFLNLNKRKTIVFVPLLILVLCFYFLPYSILLYFLIWLVGLIPHYFKLSNTWWKVCLTVFFLIWLILRKNIGGENFYYDLILAIIVSFWLASFSNENQPAVGMLKVNEFLSSFSYSLYLVHFPVIMLLLTLVRNYTMTGVWINPSVVGYCIFAGIFVLCIAFSYLIALLTEFNTNRFKQVLSSLLGIEKG